MDLRCARPANYTGRNESVSTWMSYIDEAVSTYIIPGLLLFGFICQLLNLCTLHGRRIRSMSYTLYFKTLSVNYLIGIPFLVPTLAQKFYLLDRSQYWQVFYFARLNQYFINFFLFGGNMIIVALAAEPLRAILRPLDSLRWSPRHGVHVLSILYTVTALLLLPTMFQHYVIGPDKFGMYCYWKQDGWQKLVRYLITPVFEIVLLVAIAIIYACLLISYNGIQDRHRQLISSTVRSTNSTQRPNQRESTNKKAVLICIASVTAYIISNLPSAIKEVFYLWNELVYHIHWIKSPTGRLFKSITNMCLLSNFWLIVLLQYTISAQYRNQTKNVLCKRDTGSSNYCSNTYSPHSARTSLLKKSGQIPQRQPRRDSNNSGTKL